MTNGNGAPQEAAPPPQLNVLAQYTKDLSFENPNAPSSLAPQQQQPAINIQINVSANNIAENEYEVTLSVEGKAENAGKVMFSFDLAYAGVFRIVNVPKENLHPLVMIECPRLLFPFAREIIATSVRDGGFPPLMLDPVDFVGLYRQKLGIEQRAVFGAAGIVDRIARAQIVKTVRHAGMLAPRQQQRVDQPVTGDWRPFDAVEFGVDEADIERGVVNYQRRIGDELQK